MRPRTLCLLTVLLAGSAGAQVPRQVEPRQRWSLVPEIRRELAAIQGSPAELPKASRFTPTPAGAARGKCAVPLLPMAIPEDTQFHMGTLKPAPGAMKGMPRAEVLPECPAMAGGNWWSRNAHPSLR